MWFAQYSTYQTSYNTGNINFIPDNVKVHVALAGALSGSQWATTAMVAVYGLAATPLCILAGLVVFDGSPNIQFCGSDLQPLQNSVLLDLVPQIMQTYWSYAIENTPVPVLTVAGASNWLYYPEKFFIQRGFDDGVVAMDSACGRNVPVEEWPSGFGFAGLNVADPRLYDIGANNSNTGGPTFNALDHFNCNNPVESTTIFKTSIADACGHFDTVDYFLEQNYEFLFSAIPFDVIPRAAGACAPLKTPWGMIEPTVPYYLDYQVPQIPQIPALTPWPLSYYKNHYSFLQTAEDHYGLLKGTDPGRPDTSAVLESTVYTKPQYCLPVSDAWCTSLYTSGTGLLNTAFKTAQYPATRGYSRTFHVPFVTNPIKWWIWKRTYHLLNNWQIMGAADYVYEYVN
jgi:hypothetical protein